MYYCGTSYKYLQKDSIKWKERIKKVGKFDDSFSLKIHDFEPIPASPKEKKEEKTLDRHF
jgi:hypothetical protein